MKVLITGGTGFLGSYLCDRAIERGDEVICMDNLQTSNQDNIAHLRDNPNFTFVKHDVIDPFEAEVDQIFNFACPASPPRYQTDPIHTMKTSVIGIMNMLGLAKKNGARILQASTSECYGDPHVHPQVESYWGNVNPIGIRSCYDEGKRAAETLMMDYKRQHGVDAKLVRIFNTYGPRMHPEDGRVVSNFIMQALRGEDITIYGSGEQTRSFCYCDDLINAIWSMMEADNFAGPVNIGNPDEFTILELAELVLDLVGSKSRLVFRPLPGDDPTQRRPDIGLAKGHLGWNPKVDLVAGLAPTIAYFDNWLKNNG